MSNKLFNEINYLFLIYEQEENLIEEQIAERCKELVIKNKFDREYMFALNDVIAYRGYSFQFKVPKLKTKIFKKEEFYMAIENATRSPNKTQELMNYLSEVKDARLTLSLLYALKIKHLITLGYLPSDNEYINDYLSSDLQMLFLYSRYENLEVHDLVLKLFEKIGIEVPYEDYMEFRLDVESLLLSILYNGSGKTSNKINTLKVAFNIAPREYLRTKEKAYYEEPNNELINEYIKSIDKKMLGLIKDKWDSRIKYLDNTGYKSLYLVL